MAFDSTGTFQINSPGQPVVAHTPWLASVQNALSSDIATGLTVARHAVNVKESSFGAVGDGVTNDTTAILAAITAAATSGIARIYFPAGTYVFHPAVVPNLANLTFYGDNKLSSLLALPVTGTMLTFQNAQWLKFSQLGFKLLGTPQGIANTYGVQVDTASGNCAFDDCLFLGFSKDGLRLVGTSLAQLSGMQVRNCMFLGNGGDQLYSLYSNDFHISDNQYGSLAGITHAVYGCLLDHSSAGNYEGNYHWDNGTGLKADTCNYANYSNNRVEQSGNENVLISGGSYIQFLGNRLHTPSNLATGTKDNALFQNVNTLEVSDNKLFTFDPAVYARWGMRFETCVNAKISSNGVATDSFNPAYGPIGTDSSTAGMSGDATLAAASATQIAGGSTVYLGGVENVTEVKTVIPIAKRFAVIRMWAAVDVAPTGVETATFTLRKNAADTAMVGVITGAAFSADVHVPTPGILLAFSDSITVKEVTSGGAAAAYPRMFIEVAEY